MIDWLKDWVRELVLLIFLGALLQAAMPAGAMQRYGRMVAGLFLLAALLGPLFALLREPPPLLVSAVAPPRQAGTLQQAMDGAQRRQDELTSQVFRRQVEQAAAAAAGVPVRVEAEVAGGEVGRLRLTLLQGGQAEQVRERVAGKLGLQPEQVVVR